MQFVCLNSVVLIETLFYGLLTLDAVHDLVVSTAVIKWILKTFRGMQVTTLMRQSSLIFCLLNLSVNFVLFYHLFTTGNIIQIGTSVLVLQRHNISLAEIKTM